MQQSTHHYGAVDTGEDAKVPLIVSDITLAIPQVVFNPSLDEIQQTINKISDHILTAGKTVKLWNHFELVKQHQEIEQEAARKRGEDKLKIIVEPKPFDRQLREHKAEFKIFAKNLNLDQKLNLDQNLNLYQKSKCLPIF